ncbi:hypothetical protein KAFR_0D00300 [Kazachstania africana CBS 2517]|uniref:Protein disulfide-isomerase n=1 Tax=Kazachstania africana (strain ATCC 22294 / BCRC 22015 / CBS 2517 / CECT 1963 / NBRC 1671 / NRRL Y-8276) TaxID=1071382 RepID=H2ATH7_KAZAF|nr:hypothetical protein KAFR_0D00300 [Kazachstania africana CBS 2517]CCF57677.1 hypothetical protein KAFR_0D00300 [Kazachstania africana CBS 2517]
MLFSKKTLFSLAALCVQFGMAQEAAAPADSAVVRLTSENFKDFMEHNPLVLAEFFAPWCGHCKNLAPEYVKAADILQEKGIPLVQIDCTEDQDICMEQNVPGYPTLKVFKNGELISKRDYSGARSADAIVNYMIKQSQPNVITVNDKKELTAFLEEVNQHVLVSYESENSKLNETFYKIADNLSEDYTFVSFPDKSVKDDAAKLALYVQGSDEPSYFTEVSDLLSGDFTKMESWLSTESLPYFASMNGDIFKKYMDSGLPLAYFFYTSEEEFESYSDLFSKLGKEYRGKINFVGLDSTKYGRHADNLNMKELFPLFVIHDISSNLKYGLDQLTPEEFSELTEPYTLDESEITKFVEDYANGDIEPIVKSEPIPETQETNVYKLVGKTHDEIVLDSDKDVLVKYYAPWCGHCKRLAPIYEELADVVASNKKTNNSFVIADIDDTVNDVANLQIKGYPTIILYPAGQKDKPITYEGSRSIESLLTFLEENSGNKINSMKLYKDYQNDLKIAQEEEAAKLAEKQKEAEEDDEFDDEEEEIGHDEL